MRKVEIYVDNQILDLFDDEKIQVKSSVQDVNDIAKVFTDFSQSFYVPASDNNNAIFGFYHNNEVDEFNANVRAACRIEIGLTPFRDGKLQLEGGVVKHNQVDAYKVTFYGEVVTLKDKFKEDKLNTLDYSSIDFPYTGANVKASIDSDTYQDVRFPLISSERVWTYDTGGASPQDISISSNAIVYTELFPAISDAKIMGLIASHYGVTFTGLFLTDDRLKNSYTWWKNKETTNSLTTRAIDLTFNPTDAILNSSIPDAIKISTVNILQIDLNNLTAPADWASWDNNAYYIVNLQVSPLATGTYIIDTYINGTLSSVSPVYQSAALIQVITAQYNTSGLNDTYTFKARSLTGGFDINFTIALTFRSWYTNTSNVVGFADYNAQISNTETLSTSLGLAILSPDIKVSDWFSGTLKESNLTCFPTAPLTFQIEPLEDWYANGELKDITEFVDTDKIDVDRLKLYNEISFEWEKSKAFYNVNYNSDNGKEYGSLKNSFPNNDGGKYAIKLPFENLLFNNFDTINNNLQVAYCLEDSTSPKPYIPKPVKLYLNTLKTCAFFLNNGVTFEAVTQYMPFGQSTTDNFAQYSMNFGSEFDTLNLTNVNNSLYRTYYESYLTNLFNSRTRKITLKCILPIPFLTSLKLNDELLIRDKRYRINDMTSDLTTGVVQLVLISNLQNDRGGKTTVYEVPAGTGDTGSSIKAPINVPLGGYVTVADPVETKFITSSPVIPATFTSPFTLAITVPTNTTGSDRYQTIYITGYNSSGTVIWIDTLIISQAGSDFFLLTESGGYLLQENLDKILL
jgi:hypothetical protein